LEILSCPLDDFFTFTILVYTVNTNNYYNTVFSINFLGGYIIWVLVCSDIVD